MEPHILLELYEPKMGWCQQVILLLLSTLHLDLLMTSRLLLVLLQVDNWLWMGMASGKRQWCP